MTTSRMALHWHPRSGPDDLAGFIGVYPVARAHRDCRSGLWLWSASWLAGIGARGSAAGQDEAVAAAEDAIGGWAAMAGLAEMDLTKP
jgi:hypothetical protein